MGRLNKSQTQIEGTTAFFNNKFQIVISTFNSESKPRGWTKTYLGGKKHEEKYSFYNQDGSEKVHYKGLPLQNVEDKQLKDKDGYQQRFTGFLIDDNKLFIGVLTLYRNGSKVWTFEGEFDRET